MHSPFSTVSLLLVAQATLVPALSLKPYDSLAGRSDDEVELFARSHSVVGAKPAPGAIKDTSSKLVNDKAHPWHPLRPGDIRGTYSFSRRDSEAYAPFSQARAPA